MRSHQLPVDHQQQNDVRQIPKTAFTSHYYGDDAVSGKCSCDLFSHKISVLYIYARIRMQKHSKPKLYCPPQTLQLN